MLRPIRHSESVEVLINSTSAKRYYFEDISILKNKIITRIDCFNSTADAYSDAAITYSPNNNVPVSETALKNSYLVLTKDSKEIINRIPLSLLDPRLNSNYRFLINQIVDFPKSYIEVADTSTISANQCFLLNIFYETAQEFKNYNDTYNKLKKQHKYFNSIYDIKKLNCETIEIKLDIATKDRFYFPDNLLLKNKNIVNIFIEKSLSYTVFGNTAVADTVYTKSYLVLTNKNSELYNKIPLESLRVQNNKLNNLIYFPGIIIDFPQSYIKLANVDSLTANRYFQATVFYY